MTMPWPARPRTPPRSWWELGLQAPGGNRKKREIHRRSGQTEARKTAKTVVFRAVWPDETDFQPVFFGTRKTEIGGSRRAHWDVSGFPLRTLRGETSNSDGHSSVESMEVAIILSTTDRFHLPSVASTKLSSDLLFSTWLKRFKFGQGICFNTNSMWSKLINGCTPQEMVLKIGWKYLQKGRAPYQILYTLVTNQEVLQQHSVAPPFFDVFYLSGVFLSLATSQKQSFPLQKGVLPQHLKLVKTSRIYYRMGIICLRSEVLP